MTINVSSTYLHSILTKEDNFKILCKTADKIQKGFVLKVIYKEGRQKVAEDNIRKLQNKFGDILKIED